MSMSKEIRRALRNLEVDADVVYQRVSTRGFSGSNIDKTSCTDRLGNATLQNWIHYPHHNEPFSDISRCLGKYHYGEYPS